ncbi:MAG: aldehyde dehydrogenase family protein, partial [Sphingorhabdus sp.]|nr:aldehyde dehydrogenase family protein [Sphingorhabdus sp.]
MLFQNEVELLLGRFGSSIASGNLPVHTPIDGSKIASIPLATAAEIDAALNHAQSAFLKWRSVPA